MVEEHPCFEPPVDQSIGLWRYMDLAKFMSFLDSGALYFARSDTLGDPFEGSVPVPNVEFYEKLKIDDELRKKVYPDLTPESIDKMRAQIAEGRKIFAKSMFISCWHASNHESAAMWSIYSRNDESISIKTSFEKLSNALPSLCHLGMVKYIDYNSDLIPENNLFYPFLSKRLSFEFERESRAIIWNESSNFKVSDASSSRDIIIGESGILVRIEIESLIDEIYISPTAPYWFSELIKNIVSKYKLKIPVLHSALSAAPVY